MTEWRPEMMIKHGVIKLSERMIWWGDMHEDFGKMNEAWKDVEKDEQLTIGVTFKGRLVLRLCRGGGVEDAESVLDEE